MTLQELPQKYYLQHAKELFSYVGNECAHLLDQSHQQYLTRFYGLDQNAQCLLIRLLARKHPFIKLSSLTYSEIQNMQFALDSLVDNEFIRSPAARDWSALAPLMTKPELLSVLRGANVFVKSSLKKSELIEFAMENLTSTTASKARAIQQYVVKRHQDVTDYLFFLFFGDLRNRFQKFAMRDLGVLKTRATTAEQQARYETEEIAKQNYQAHRIRREFQQNPEVVRESTQAYLLREDHHHSTQTLRNKLIVDVGNHLVADDPASAIELWRTSSEPEPTEKWVRLSYKEYGKQVVESDIKVMLDREDLPPQTEVFVADFYERKYLGKRTSIYTDMLRESSSSIGIDEAYLGNVEQGVIDAYARKGKHALFCENKVWKVLFAFTFWELLYTQDTNNEFDRYPSVLRDPQFYQRHKTAIEKSLEQLNNKKRALANFTKLAAAHYGVPTGLFRWRPDMMDLVTPLLNLAPENALQNVLRRMSKHFDAAKDGYPDLMIIEDGKVRFEEVKAPGDVLRPNQLIAIQRLRKSGFDVGITQVHWETNPEQVYAVVDIETTGGRRGGNSITEIAVVKVKNGEIIGEWSSLINPQRPIPRHITQLTGIDDAMVAGAPVFSEVSDRLKQELQDAIFVAHNVGFDYGFIKAAYEDIGQTFHKPKYCTVVNSRKAFPGLKSYSLGKLSKALDIDLNNHHRALADATATAHVLRLIQAGSMEDAH